MMHLTAHHGLEGVRRGIGRQAVSIEESSQLRREVRFNPLPRELAGSAFLVWLP